MKKLLIILSLFVLMTTAVLGGVQSVTKLDDLGVALETSADTVECEYSPLDNKLYCFGYPVYSPQADRFIIWTYDLDTQVIENKTATLPYTPLGGFWGNYYSLWYYNGEMWGLSSYGKAFSYDIVSDTTTNLTGTNSNLPYLITGHTCCAVDEGTDDVYCVGGVASGIFKYEMDTDIYTALDNPITDQTRMNMGDMCDYDQTRDKLYWVLGSYTVNSTQKSGYEVYAYDVAGDTHTLVGSFPNITANPSDPTYDGIRNGYCQYVGHENTFYCFTVDDDNYQYDEIFYIDVTTGVSGVSDVYLHENISFSTCDRISGVQTLCYGGFYGQDDWYDSDDLFEIVYDLPAEPANPTITNVTTMGGDLLIEPFTWSDGTNIYIFSQGDNDISKYDITTFTKSFAYSHNIAWTIECVYYPADDHFYCFQEYTAGQDHFKIDIPMTTATPLTNWTLGNDTSPDIACDLRPTTDEIYCWGSSPGNWDNYIRKYDISEDSWTNLMNVGYANNYAGWKGGEFPECAFRDSTEFWCMGGQVRISAGSVFPINYILVYDVVTNITQNKYMAVKLEQNHCTWVDDIFYCFAGDSGENLESVIAYYDPVYDVSGNLTTEFPAGFGSYGSCSDTADDVAYCLGGFYGVDWDESDTVFKISWAPPEPEDGGEATENTTYAEGNYSIPSNFTVSGDDIVVNFSGSVLTNGSVVITGNNVVVTDLVVEEALVVTGSNVDYTSVERVGITFTEFRVNNDTTDLIVEVDLTDVDLALEETDGKVDFTTNVDLTVYGDLDVVVDIGVNSITIDSTTAPNLNVPARITFFNTGYNNPEEVLIYKNGELCADCTLVSVDSGVVVADVTGFSTYLLVGVGLDISQENFLTLRDNMIYILGAFGVVVVLIAAMIILTFVFSGAQVDMTQIIVVVLMLAVGFAALLAVFVTIMRNFAVV